MDPVNQVIAAILESENITGGASRTSPTGALGRLRRRIAERSGRGHFKGIFGGNIRGGSVERGEICGGRISGGSLSGGSRELSGGRIRGGRRLSGGQIRGMSGGQISGGQLRGGEDQRLSGGKVRGGRVSGGKKLEAGRVPKSLRRKRGVFGGMGCEGRTWSQALTGVGCNDARIKNAKAYTS